MGRDSYERPEILRLLEVGLYFLSVVDTKAREAQAAARVAGNRNEMASFRHVLQRARRQLVELIEQIGRGQEPTPRETEEQLDLFE